MAADVKAQAFVLRETISDYPQHSLLDAATIASAKTLPASGRERGGQRQKCAEKKI